jgi:hypothetical protein
MDLVVVVRPAAAVVPVALVVLVEVVVAQPPVPVVPVALVVLVEVVVVSGFKE